MDQHKEVPADIYDRDYYLTDNEGCREYREGFETNCHHKFERALRLGDPQPGENVLDIGCGRGELVYYSVMRGAKALGIDYSSAAIGIAAETLGRLPEEKNGMGRVEVADVVKRPFDEKFDVVFMIDIVEHMYDWQLKEAFTKIAEILSEKGRLIITTPNDHYETILQPVKRVVDIPSNIVKWTGRILRGKFKPANFGEFWKKCCKIRVDRESLEAMHVNVLTPGRLKRLLKESGLKAAVFCEDPSYNILSLLTKKWWGREIIVIAGKGK